MASSVLSSMTCSSQSLYWRSSLSTCLYISKLEIRSKGTETKETKDPFGLVYVLISHRPSVWYLWRAELNSQIKHEGSSRIWLSLYILIAVVCKLQTSFCSLSTQLPSLMSCKANNTMRQASNEQVLRLFKNQMQENFSLSFLSPPVKSGTTVTSPDFSSTLASPNSTSSCTLNAS